jgi:hypothetical protein
MSALSIRASGKAANAFSSARCPVAALRDFAFLIRSLLVPYECMDQDNSEAATLAENLPLEHRD